MNFRMSHKVHLLAVAASLVFVVSSSALGFATINIQNNDGVGVGFNDPTVVSPVGGNPGTTLGQQRLNAFQAAANIWGATLTSSVTITIRAQWSALTCNSTTAVLGSAGTVQIFSDFANAPFPGTWYGGALANKLAGSDLDVSPEINANFNVNLGNPGCLDGTHFYLGLDNNHGSDIDLFTVLLHEFSHGFGFQTFTSASTGAQFAGLPSIYDRFLFDNSTGKTWIQMTNFERQTSAINTGQLAWNGFQVKSFVHTVLSTPFLKINLPAAIAGNYLVGTAAFGPALNTTGVTANIVQAVDPADGSGALTTDGCSAITNAGTVAGNIALIDRGTCTFVTKVKNAQNAGAVGVVIANNVATAPITMGGSDPTITIPAVMVSLSDGTTIRNQFGVGVNGTMLLDTTVPSGADIFGRALMYTPNPFEGGSSVSHWDTSLYPNQLMEPNINGDLTHSVTTPQDLTFSQLRDVGWVADASTSIQFSASNYNVSEGGAFVTITVTRTGDTQGAATVDYMSSDGSAKQMRDYAIASGTLSFGANDTSKTFDVSIIDDSFIETAETLNLTLSNAMGAVLGGPSTATVTISDNDTVGSISPVSKRFAAFLDGAQETPPNNSIAKGTGLELLNANETSALVGLQFQNLSSAETAAHIHGNGAPGVMAPILFPLTPPVNPLINFQISPNTQQVTDLRANLHYMNVHSNNFVNGEIRGQLLWNPTLEEGFFVRQQYLDLLSREPDTTGFNFWVAKIAPCQADTQCFHDMTIGVSDAFFFETEFQQTAGFVFRAYRASFGNSQPFPDPDGSNPTEANKLVEYSTFVADRARVIGSADLAARQLAFANLFVSRPAFTTKYAGFATAAQFVDAILATIQTADNVDLTSQRQALIDQYNVGGRGMVLYRLSDDNAQNPINNQAFINAEYNRQFAYTLYVGYLRRDPEFPGFLFWQTRINLAPVRDVPKQQALVCSFITAAEYFHRFGLDAPRSNAECPQQ